MDFRTFNVKIEKVGRKWIHCTVIADSFSKKAKIVFDDTSKSLKVADEVKATFEFNKIPNRYFGSFDWILRLISEEEVKEIQKEEKEQERLKNLNDKKQRVVDFLGYIEESIDKYSKPYWYSNGEKTVIELLHELERDFSEETKGFRQEVAEELERLHNDYIRKKEAYRESERKNVIYVSRFSGPYREGDIIERDGKYYKIVRVGEFYEPDSLSFGGWEDGQMMYEAHADCRKVTEKEIEEFKKEKAEKERKIIEQKEERKRIESLKKEKSDTLNEIVAFIKKGRLNESKKILSEIEVGGKIVLDTFTMYGFGEKIILKDDVCWFVINNGGDGSDWSINSISTGGAGAYGYYCKATKELKELVEKFVSIEID